MKPLCSGTDQALIAMTGLDHGAFACLEEKLTLKLNNCLPWVSGNRAGTRHLMHNRSEGGRGRPRALGARMSLGLALMQRRSRGTKQVLQLALGLAGASLAKQICFGRCALLKALASDKHAQAALPHAHDIEARKQATAECHPHLPDVTHAADGAKLLLECSGNDPGMESALCNGWRCDHCVGNAFLFAPDGTAPACALGAPGSFHVSTVADCGHLCDKLGCVRTVIDSAPPLSRKPCLLHPEQL